MTLAYRLVRLCRRRRQIKSLCLHRRARQQRHCDQHGWQGRLAGQCVRRAAVAQRQIRGGVSEGVASKN